MEEIKYPIGRFKPPHTTTPAEVTTWIDEIEGLPKKLREEVISLSSRRLDTPYRKNGWTVRQVVHHIADSHLNSYTRFKLALTEERPTIKPYKEKQWAKLSDSQLPVEPSLTLIDGLHQRWSYLLRSLDKNQLSRELIHPEAGTIVLKNMIAHYAWHGNHHLGHITTLKKKRNW